MNFHVWTFFQCRAKYLCVREKFSFVCLKLIFGSNLRRKSLDACDKNGLSWKWYRFRWKLLRISHWSPLSCQEIKVHSVYTLILPEIYIICESFDLQIIFHSFPRINTNIRLLHRYHCLPWIINDESIHKNCHETKSIWFFRRSSAIVAFHRSLLSMLCVAFCKSTFSEMHIDRHDTVNISDKIDVF